MSNQRIDAAAELLHRRARLASAELSVAGVGTRPAGETPPSHPLVSCVVAVRRAVGLPPARFAEASTDANAALARGIPAIAVGLGHGQGQHTRAERVDTTGLDCALTALAKLLDARTAKPAGSGS